MTDARPIAATTSFVREADGRIRPPRLFSAAGLDAAFWADGFVTTSCLGATLLDDLARRFGELEPADGFDPATLDDPRCGYHCTFLDTDVAYRQAADELVREVFGGPLAAIAPGYRILSSNIYVKPPGAGRFEIHQNWPTIEDLDVPTLTAWIPLQDTSFANGTIRLVRGSHHLFPDVAAASSDRFFDGFEQRLIEDHLEPVPVGAGEALVFDDSLLHWSGANLSTRARVTFQIELVPIGWDGVLWIRSEDGERFDLWAAEKEFWTTAPFRAVLTPPPGLEGRGSRPNPNTRLSYDQFLDTLRRGDEIRRSRYVLD